jgi:glucose-1-phosphate adenylyltransferase
MDFNEMIEEHIKHEADIIATLPVNAKDAEFRILKCGRCIESFIENRLKSYYRNGKSDVSEQMKSEGKLSLPLKFIYIQ